MAMTQHITRKRGPYFVTVVIDGTTGHTMRVCRSPNNVNGWTDLWKKGDGNMPASIQAVVNRIKMAV